ncbi:MAG: hypothetical protein LBB31_02720 [Prevotellaceae bacterium]|jgi:hypothetical protein|nr:hypothetical protein [Prevotellaceae bacterium]
MTFTASSLRLRGTSREAIQTNSKCNGVLIIHNFFLRLAEVFCCLQTQTFYYTKYFLAAIFYSLPMIAEKFNSPFLQFGSSTFTVIFSLFHKKPKVEMGAVFIASRGSRKPTQ